MVTQKDVAEYANVSFITVSRVINKKGSVKAETRERVEKAIKELNYYPNTFARGLNANTVNTIAVLPYLHSGAIMEETSYHRRIIIGIERCCMRYGFDILLSTHHELTEDFDILRPYYMRKADGLILIGVDPQSTHFAKISQDNIPCSIIAERDLETSANLLDSDNRLGTRLIVEYLVRHGHSKIAYLTVDTATRDIRDRFESFKEVMSENKLEVPDAYLFSGNYMEESGRNTVRQIASMAERPTALVAATDVLALGAYDEAKTVGLQVPDDLSIVGFDGHEFTSFTSPPLATVIQDFEGMGYLASELVIRQINKEQSDSKSHIFPVVFEPRGSIKSYLA